MARRFRVVALTVALAGLVRFVVACGDASGLPPAAFENAVDTVSLFALSGTPIATPSAYDLIRRSLDQPLVRTDQSSSFDFAFDFDSLGRAALFPTGALRLGLVSALQRSTSAFDAITLAPTDGWVFDSPFVVDAGAVLLVRSRATTCITGIRVPLYAKLEVHAIDTNARRIDFRILVDQNCGYRGLEPGVPQQ